MFKFEAQNFINALANLNEIKAGAYNYQGYWNASTNVYTNAFTGATGNLVDGVGTQGHYYFVAVAGDTEINGQNDWEQGDWIWFDSGTWKLVRNDSYTTDNIEIGESSTFFSESQVLSTSLTGLSENNSAITDLDNILAAFGKAQGQINSLFTGKQDSLGFTPENSANKNQNNGYAGLDSSGKIYGSQLPALAITDTEVVDSEAGMLLLTDFETGDIAVRTDLNKSFILKGTDPTNISHWQELLTPTDAVQSVQGKTGAITDLRLNDLAAASGDYNLNGNNLENLNKLTNTITSFAGYGSKTYSISTLFDDGIAVKEFGLDIVNENSFLSTQPGTHLQSKLHALFLGTIHGNKVRVTGAGLLPVGSANLGDDLEPFANIYGVNSILSGDFTMSDKLANSVPYLNADKKLVSSVTTPTELGYLSGVTSAIQTQLNAKGNISGQTWTGEHNFPYFVGVNSSEIALTDGATFRGRRQLGPGGQVVTNTVLSGVYAAGWTNAGTYSNNAAAFRMLANQSFTAANQGAYMDWQLNQNGQNFRTTFMILQNSAAGGLTLGSTAGTGTGALFAGDGNFTGAMKFGTYTAIGSEILTGYITITDAAGNTRKLAVVS